MSTVTTGLTRAPAGGTGPLHPPGSTGLAQRGSVLKGFWQNAKLYLVLFALMAPSLIALAVFTYYPQFGAIKYSFYKWDGTEQGLDWIGFKNYIEAFTADPLFWQSFKLVLILLAANIIKMFPSIAAAVTLHRLKSERFQYIYRVLFVVPMIIPSVVSLLIWKSFFDGSSGALNVFLNATGLMGGLKHLDYAMAGLAASPFGTAVREQFVVGGISGLWLLAIIGVVLIVGRMAARGVGIRDTARGWAILTASGVALIAAAIILALLTCVWPTKPLHQFDFGAPAWLGNQNLIIPSVIFWGFPWIGTVGVLIYLAGLQNITADVYEAAELDGVGSIRKLFAIELPLILTQVRINLIFLTIGTITDYGFFLLLLGPDGGPGGKGMVPGLYMYESAFIESRFGYSCALGMILFVILLAITVLYQKFVRVDK